MLFDMIGSPMRIKLRRYPQTQVLIHESTLASCVLAWRLAGQGLGVTLVASGTSPLHEMIAAMRPWLFDTTLHHVPDPFRQRIVEATKHITPSGRRILHAGELVVAVEDLLLDASVRLLYGARPAAVLATDSAVSDTMSDLVTDVVYGGKFGLAALPARYIIDASHHADVARLAGATFQSLATDNSTPPNRWLYTLLCNEQQATARQWPVNHPLASGVVRCDDSFAEFQLDFPTAEPSPINAARRLVDMQRIVCDSILRDDVPLPVRPFMCPDIALRIPDKRLVSRDDADEINRLKSSAASNLLLFGPASACDAITPDAFIADPARACAWGEAVAPAVLADACQVLDASAIDAEPRLKTAAADCSAEETMHCSDPQFSEPYTSHVEIDMPALPVVAEADVVVAGGGTSGFPAAVTAAAQGLNVICTENHGAFGGANTVGGVSKLWFGHWNPFFQRYYLRTKHATNGIELPTSLAFLHASPRSRLELLPGTPACGVMRNGRAIVGVCVITDAGLGVVRGRQIIDATGDGDIAAWAGNPYTWGSERDEMTLWYSFGRFHHGNSEASRNYSSVVDTRSWLDTSRAVIVGRRQAGVFGVAEYPQYYLAVRETRHITGRTRVSYLDMLMNRHFDDAVLVCQSNIDIKGMHASDAVMAGMIDLAYRRNYRCVVPYRAFLPAAFDNLFISGKAYSISHDALSMARMQPDMMTLGAVAGFAAAQAHHTGRCFADLDVPTLQQRLFDEGIITPCDAAPTFDRLIPADGELEALADHVGMSPAELSTQARLVAAGPPAARHLARVIETVSGYKTNTLARMLCILRHPAGADILLKQLQCQLGDDRPLPEIASDGKHLMPDHGWAPPPVHDLNALALLAETRLTPLLDKLARRITLAPDRCDSRFSYVHAIAHAFERLADPAGQLVLESLLEQPALHNPVMPRSGDLRACADDVQERHAYLALCLARALARCGSAAGYQRLIDYLDDHRLHLVRSAVRELHELTGESHGFDQRQWQTWLKARAENLAPQPLNRSYD